LFIFRFIPGEYTYVRILGVILRLAVARMKEKKTMKLATRSLATKSDIVSTNHNKGNQYLLG